MITVNSEITTSTIEQLLSEIHKSSVKQYVDLKLPVNLKPIGFGAFASLIQLIISWRRLENCGKLIIGSKEISANDIEEVVRNYYGLIASVLAWDTGIVNFNGVDVKSQIRDSNAITMTYLLKGRFDEASRGDSILFPFFDHLDNKSGLLPLLYYRGELRRQEEFENLTDVLIDIATKNNKIVKEDFRTIQTELTDILYEAFDNTNKWARRSFTGKILNPNVRGVYGRFYKLERKNIPTYTNSNGLTNYFREISLRNPSTYRFITFLEVSIFDGGSGLAQRYSGKSLETMSLEDEYTYLIDCLKKHNTSHKEPGIVGGRGIGLFTIMDLLHKKKGYLRVRSGRMSLYRDFLRFPFYSTSDSSPNYALIDVDTDSVKPSNKPKAEGTLITIIIPQIK
jgi:hypothetical protein